MPEMLGLFSGLWKPGSDSNGGWTGTPMLTARKAIVLVIAVSEILLGYLVTTAPHALADAEGYPYASMPCELAPYNTVGYCNTKYGPYDWGPVKNGSAASQNSPYGYGYR